MDYRRSLAGLWVAGERVPIPDRPTPPVWNARRATAIFRGGATGSGVTATTNVRLLLCSLSRVWHDSRRHQPEALLDARLTSWNPRHKLGVDNTVYVIDPTSACPPLTPRSGASSRYRLSMQAQAKCKYYVLVDGNVGASRLGELAELRFVILWVRSWLPQVSHAHSALHPWVHYVPLRGDLSNLEASLLWLRCNDDDAQAMATALHGALRPRLERVAMEEELARTCQQLPGPMESRHFADALRWVWRELRSAVYVLLAPDGQLLEFRPFAHRKYCNAWGAGLRLESGTLRAFLQKSRSVAGPERILLDVRRWWANGSLVCNVMPTGVWGESMLVELHAMLLGAGARWRLKQDLKIDAKCS